MAGQGCHGQGPASAGARQPSVTRCGGPRLVAAVAARATQGLSSADPPLASFYSPARPPHPDLPVSHPPPGNSPFTIHHLPVHPLPVPYAPISIHPSAQQLHHAPHSPSAPDTSTADSTHYPSIIQHLPTHSPIQASQPSNNHPPSSPSTLHPIIIHPLIQSASSQPAAQRLLHRPPNASFILSVHASIHLSVRLPNRLSGNHCLPTVHPLLTQPLSHPTIHIIPSPNHLPSTSSHPFTMHLLTQLPSAYPVDHRVIPLPPPNPSVCQPSMIHPCKPSTHPLLLLCPTLTTITPHPLCRAQHTGHSAFGRTSFYPTTRRPGPAPAGRP